MIVPGERALAGAPPPDPGKVAYFGLHFIDTSGEGALNGVRADETARIEMASRLVADELTARGFTVEIPPADKVASVLDPADSNGADARIAHEMGARYAVSGQVQKTSNLILALNLYIRDAETGRTLRFGVVDIRGNTDESFRRGYRYLLKNIIFRRE